MRGAQGVGEALSQIPIRPHGNSELCSPGQAEREELIQKPRGDRRDVAKKPQVSLHALHKVYKVYSHAHAFVLFNVKNVNTLKS